jgi:hypothetical protein
MVAALQFLCAMSSAVAMSLALAHALELPGKLRLGREEYLAVQTIYYPGFTIGGAAEPLTIIALAALLFTLPEGSRIRWLIAAAFIAAVATQILFWAVVQPVNRVWLKSIPLDPAGKRFFGTNAATRETSDWTQLRDRWELGHLARAVTATAAFVLTLVAIIAR